MLISFFLNHYRVIVACCVLHKIALDRNQYLEEDELANVDLICDEDHPPTVPNVNLSDSLIRRQGFAKRQKITENVF